MNQSDDRMLARLNEIVRLLSRIEKTALAGAEIRDRIEALEVQVCELSLEVAQLRGANPALALDRLRRISKARKGEPDG